MKVQHLAHDPQPPVHLLNFCQGLNWRGITHMIDCHFYKVPGLIHRELQLI